ncbi:hypothetical protein GUJ93_ZPchr0001g31065 [Zizania palustris]|uniref:Uncharacterized protein n=1 Tax=Zizania palustris TaxID=103762 RepID=A0A8J5V014_ZIZPA|nr:hypothetical protein GUJ93_ZPchr0001g31065 [Zizania palustris]
MPSALTLRLPPCGPGPPQPSLPDLPPMHTDHEQCPLCHPREPTVLPVHFAQSTASCDYLQKTTTMPCHAPLPPLPLVHHIGGSEPWLGEMARCQDNGIECLLCLYLTVLAPDCPPLQAAITWWNHSDAKDPVAESYGVNEPGFIAEFFGILEGDYNASIQCPSLVIPPVLGADEFACCSKWNAGMTKLAGWQRDEDAPRMARIGEGILLPPQPTIQDYVQATSTEHMTVDKLLATEPMGT